MRRVKAALSWRSTYSTVRPFRAAMRSCSRLRKETTTCDEQRTMPDQQHPWRAHGVDSILSVWTPNVLVGSAGL